MTCPEVELRPIRCQDCTNTHTAQILRRLEVGRGNKKSVPCLKKPSLHGSTNRLQRAWESRSTNGREGVGNASARTHTGIFLLSCFCGGAFTAEPKKRRQSALQSPPHVCSCFPTQGDPPYHLVNCLKLWNLVDHKLNIHIEAKLYLPDAKSGYP